MRQIHLHLPADSAAPSAARQGIGRIDALPPDRLPDVQLMVSELVTNAVKYGLHPDGIIEVRATLRDGSLLRVEVEDRGEGLGLALLEIGGASAGLGLLVVDRLADRFGVGSGLGPFVWFEMDLD